MVDQVKGLEYDTVLADLQKLNIDWYPKLGPDPTRWVTITNELGKLHKGKAQKVITDGQNVDIFQTIYATSPRLKPYARTTLNTLFYTGLPLILCSLATDFWTNIKLEKTRTKHLFSHVETVDVHQHTKTSHDWIRAARRGNVKPTESIAMGDSRDSDVWPAHDANFKLLVWIPSHWGTHSSTEQHVPNNTLRVDRVRNLVKHLLQI